MPASKNTNQITIVETRLRRPWGAWAPSPAAPFASLARKFSLIAGGRAGQWGHTGGRCGQVGTVGALGWGPASRWEDRPGP